MAHGVGDVDVGGVHPAQGVAAPVHLEHFGHVGFVEPGGMRVAVIARLDMAGQVGPGAVGEVGGLLLTVALADRDAGPRLGLDVDRLPDALPGGVQSFGRWGDEVFGVVGPARVTAPRAEE